MKGQIQLLGFRLEGRHYGVRLSQVRRVVRAVDWAPLPQAPANVLGAIDLEGEIVALLSLRRKFGLMDREVGVDDQFIIARTARRTAAIVVDDVVGIFECSPADIVAAEKILPHLAQIEGVLQLEEGLMLIHDLDRFLALDEEQALDEALKTEPARGN
jgi:purine-binding chemotaxis protein CheW